MAGSAHAAGRRGTEHVALFRRGRPGVESAKKSPAEAGMTSANKNAVSLAAASASAASTTSAASTAAAAVSWGDVATAQLQSGFVMALASNHYRPEDGAEGEAASDGVLTAGPLLPPGNPGTLAAS
jgi:hypothetical protein